MTTVGQTTVTMTLGDYATMLERAAQMAVNAANDGTVVELTVRGIAATLLLETVNQRPVTNLRGAQDR